MTEQPSNSGKWLPDDVQLTIETDVSHDGEGTVYAVQIAERGEYRVEFKIGHIDGTYAEGTEYYYDGEQLYQTFYKAPENAPSGKYKDVTFHELLDGETTIEDGELTVTNVYDAEGVDTTEWAVERFSAFEMSDYWEDLTSVVEEREAE